MTCAFPKPSWPCLMQLCTQRPEQEAGLVEVEVEGERVFKQKVKLEGSRADGQEGECDDSCISGFCPNGEPGGLESLSPIA